MKSVIVHGALALFGLSFAYQTWTRPPEQEQPVTGETATILECEESKLGSVELETPTHAVRFVPQRGARGVAYWATTQRKKPEPEAPLSSGDAPKAGAGAGAAGAAADTPENELAAADKAKPDAKADPNAKAAADAKAAEKPAEKKQARPYDPDAPVTFLANQKFHELLKSLAPLRALRSLGEIPKDKYTEFGFDKVGTFLRIECGGKKVTLDIGGRTYGAGDRYAHNQANKESFLLTGSIVNDLQSAQFKFTQADLHDFTLADVDEASISALGKERKLLHRARLNKEDARWVDASAPDKRNELFGNWFQRLERLKAKGYLAEGQEPGADLQVPAKPPKPVVVLQYKLEGKPKDKLELVRVDTDEGNFYYARSDTTRRWVTLYDSLAKQVEEDVAMVVGAEEQPAASESKLPAGTVDPHDAMPAGHPPVPRAAPAANPHGHGHGHGLPAGHP